MFPIEPYEPIDSVSKFYSAVTISLGELLEIGMVDFEREDWLWDAYNEEQRKRVNKKIIARYYDRNIGILPGERWQRRFIGKLNEIMPKYKPLYAALESGTNILQSGDTYGKSREIYSDFPATQLGDNQDYATNGRDREYENIEQSDYVEKAMQIAKEYDDVDVMILDDLEILFSCLLSVSLNGR